jgi:hypothetical protein
MMVFDETWMKHWMLIGNDWDVGDSQEKSPAPNS